MKKNIIPFMCLTLLNYASPALSSVSDLTLSPSAINFANPSDSVIDFQLLSGVWNAETHKPKFCAKANIFSSDYKKGTIISASLASGYKANFDGVEYTIFTTNTPGVGWIMGAKDTNAPVWTPLTSNETMVFPFTGSGSQSSELGANVRFAFVKLPGGLKPGNNNFPSQNIARFVCTNTSNGTETAMISVNTTSINVSALACRLSSASTVPVPLGEFDMSELPAVGGNFGDFQTSSELTCDSGVIPWMTISDASDSANISNVIKLSPDSVAKGVGVQVFYNSEAIAKNLGKDSSVKGNPNQFSIGTKTTSNNQIVSIPLGFKYIRTESDVVAGTANANATITFSYQ